MSEDFEITGRINAEHGMMIQGLLDVPKISIQLSCLPRMTTSKNKPESSKREQCELELTTFGIPELFDEIGRWLQDFDAYLPEFAILRFIRMRGGPRGLLADVR
jgi:hypothetical protein